MKSLLTLMVFVVLIFFTPCARAGWVVTANRATIDYVAKADQGHAVLNEALKEWSERHAVDALKFIGVDALLADKDFQEEIFAALRRDAPREWKEALASAGNMHNPKLHQLRPAFLKAVMTTETGRQISKALGPYWLRVTRMECEKFSIRKDAAGPRSFGMGWLLRVGPGNDDPEQRRPFPLPPCPPNCTVVLYGPVPHGLFGAEAEKTDWKPLLSERGIKIPPKGFALFYLPARIIAVATDSENQNLAAILFE